MLANMHLSLTVLNMVFRERARSGVKRPTGGAWLRRPHFGGHVYEGVTRSVRGGAAARRREFDVLGEFEAKNVYFIFVIPC